jgi:hypothetical protein
MRHLAGLIYIFVLAIAGMGAFAETKATSDTDIIRHVYLIGRDAILENGQSITLHGDDHPVAEPCYGPHLYFDQTLHHLAQYDAANGMMTEQNFDALEVAGLKMYRLDGQAVVCAKPTCEEQFAHSYLAPALVKTKSSGYLPNGSDPLFRQAKKTGTGYELQVVDKSGAPIKGQVVLDDKRTIASYNLTKPENDDETYFEQCRD